MADSLSDLLGSMKGHMPKVETQPSGRVNPPEAAKVVNQLVLPEIAGEEEAEALPLPTPAPTKKPEEVKAAEKAKKPTRTAKVVQEELDEALATIRVLEKRLKKAQEGQISSLTLGELYAKLQRESQ